MFVLASASKARQKLLDQIAFKYLVVTSDLDEKTIDESDPFFKVQHLAKMKAYAVFDKLIDEKESPIKYKALLGCDSLFEFQGEIFGKPKNKEQLISRLKRMSGKSGLLHTGHYLMINDNSKVKVNSLSFDRCFEGVVTTKLEFSSLSNNEIIKYASTSEPYQCAGGFAIEGKGGIFIKKIEGCFSNVIGLSLPWLKTNLEQCGLSDLFFEN